ncbi:MAG: DsbA family protein [Stellaceae bacterium]
MKHILWFSAALVLAIAAVPAARAADAVPHLAPDDIVLGKAEAPITIFEYASLTCPHCAEFDQDTFPEVKKNWIDPGKAKLVFRDYPLDQYALKAAMVAHCAPPDRFFAFIDVLFREQANWAAAGNADQVTEALSRIARLGGISEQKFNTCIADKALSDRILNERLVAQNQYGVDSTPTFFINGKKIVGALPYDQFSKDLNAAAAASGALHFGEAAPPHPSE